MPRKLLPWWSWASITALIAGSLAFGLPGSANADENVTDESVTVQLAGGISSDNMTYVATIPIDSPGVSAKVREVDGQRLLYVSGVKGLSIYSIDDPTLPLLVGHLPLPHSQNEDVEVSEDGTRAIIAADGNLPAPNPVTKGLHVVDTSDPSSPTWQAWLDDVGGGSNHTATCADAACEWIYGSAGAIYHAPADADSGEDIEIVGSWFDLDERVNGSHALNRSVHPDPETGEPVSLMISDSTPRLIMDATDPGNPVLLATSDPADHEGDGFLQHNNARPNAAEWVPRSADAGGDDGRGPTGLPDRAADRARDRLSGGDEDDQATDPFGGHLRPGELLIGNSESNVVPQCTDQSGGLTTFSIQDFDQGAVMEPLHSFRPVQGNWLDGNAAVNGLGCSGHWFDIRDGDNLIAASWYEHGIKVIEVLPDYSMQEIAYFQPVAGAAGAATWVTDDDGSEYIISTDYARGVDIVRFDRSAPRPTDPELQAAHLAAASSVQPLAEAERQFCRLAGLGS